MGSRRDRYREIVETLSVHGFGFTIGAMGLQGRFPFRRGLPGHQQGRTYTQPEHLRLALEQLGPTFVKLGQLLSTRSDLLPSEYTVELAKLQDAAPPVPEKDIRGTLAEELRTDLVPLCVKTAASAPVLRVRRRWSASMSFVRWGAPR